MSSLLGINEIKEWFTRPDSPKKLDTRDPMSLNEVGSLRLFLTGIVWNCSWESSVTGGQFKAVIDQVVVVVFPGKEKNKEFSSLSNGLRNSNFM